MDETGPSHRRRWAAVWGRTAGAATRLLVLSVLVGPGTAVRPLAVSGLVAADPTAPRAGAAGAGVEPGAVYGWPLRPPPTVVTPFGAPDDPYGPGHRGVDLAGSPGQQVLAARSGTVSFAGTVAGHGVVAVDHDDGLRTTYEPLDPAVTAGQHVDGGAVLGLLQPGHPGCSGTCLHWGVRRDRLTYLDPLVLLGPPHVRLLPVPVPWPG